MLNMATEFPNGHVSTQDWSTLERYFPSEQVVQASNAIEQVLQLSEHARHLP